MKESTRIVINKHPIYRKDIGKWFFWDKVEDKEVGPYPTYQKAEEQLNKSMEKCWDIQKW